LPSTWKTAADARALVKRIGERVGFIRLGWSCTPPPARRSLRELIDQGKEVFLDLKMYDIRKP